ncbi:MAG: MFS transporter [Vicinamibacterales bacterium]
MAPSGARWVLPATILGSSLGFIDGSVVNVALPSMQVQLDTPLTALQWVVNGYMLTLASLILLGGSAGDRYGRRRAFLAGLAGFGAASLACGLAPSASWLVAARLIQGAAAALLVPSSLAIIGAAFTGDARGPAIGTWAAAGAITTALGPPLGGWLVDAVGWRAIFFINLPVAALALLLGSRLPRDRGEASSPLDARGAALAVVTLGLLSYGLIALGEGAGVRGGTAIAASLPAGAWFVRTERRSSAPMMPVSLFADRTFAGANALTVLLYAALSGALFILPFVLIRVHGASATQAGAALLPFSALMAAGSRWAGGLVERLGPRLPLVTGAALASFGYGVLGLLATTGTYLTAVLPGLLIVSVGMMLSVAPLTTTVFDAAPSDMSGAASGINNAAARAGGMVAVAALGLAFGASGGGEVDAAVVSSACRIVMLAAAVLAAVSGGIAALTIGGRRPSDRPGALRSGPSRPAE